MNKIDTILTNVSFDNILTHYNLHGNIKNNAVWICCPFHTEKTPSLQIKNNKFTCYGCHKYGDVINFVSYMENCDSKQAVALIDSWFGLGLNKPLTVAEKRKYAEQARNRKRVAERKLYMEKFAKDCYFMIAYKLKRIEADYEKWLEIDRLDYLYNLIAVGIIIDSRYKYIYGTDKVDILRQIYKNKIII